MYAREGLLDELEADVDRLNRTDLSGPGSVVTEDALVALERIEAKLAAFKARLCRKYDVEKEWARKGAQHPGAVIATMRRVPSKTCRRPFTLGRKLEELPALHDALARGTVNLQHRDRILGVDNARVHERFVEDHETFVAWAEALDWPTFEMHLVLWSHMHDPDGPDPADGRRGLDFSQTWRNEFVLNGTMGAMAERSATGPEVGRKGAILASVLLGPDAARWLCEFTTGTRIRPAQLAPHVDDVTFETANPAARSTTAPRATRCRRRTPTHDRADERSWRG